MRLLYTFGAVALLAKGMLGAAATTDTPDVKVVEEIVAKVNGDIITRGELEKTHSLIEAELRKQGMSGEEAVRKTSKPWKAMPCARRSTNFFWCHEARNWTSKSMPRSRGALPSPALKRHCRH